jgi:hypothetical protein
MARSAAAIEASRRNGARSAGPVSPAGKAASSRNARKHGLFGQGVAHDDVLPSPSFRRVQAFVAAHPSASRAAMVMAMAELASQRLARAAALVRDGDAALMTALDNDADEREIGILIEQVCRLRSYQRRFRGQRDRAVRQALHCLTPDAGYVI